MGNAIQKQINYNKWCNTNGRARQINKETSFLCRKYKLDSIKRVEKKEDPEKGVRYLLELIVKDRTNDKSYILAEYVFQSNGKNVPLCYPKGLQWNRTADVYLILTAKNLGRWVHHFIKNVEKIVEETQDEHLHAVIYDFDSPDIDLKQAFQRSTLKNYRYITTPGKYSRTVSFSEAIESIKNPNAIVVTMDLHLDIGSQFINDVRKVGLRREGDGTIDLYPSKALFLLDLQINSSCIVFLGMGGLFCCTFFCPLGHELRKFKETVRNVAIFPKLIHEQFCWMSERSRNLLLPWQPGFDKQFFIIMNFYLFFLKVV